LRAAQAGTLEHESDHVPADWRAERIVEEP